MENGALNGAPPNNTQPYVVSKNLFVRIKYVESTVSPNTIKDIYLSIFVDYICKRLNFKLVDV